LDGELPRQPFDLCGDLIVESHTDLKTATDADQISRRILRTTTPTGSTGHKLTRMEY
jgi:hypothetical protein